MSNLKEKLKQQAQQTLDFIIAIQSGLKLARKEHERATEEKQKNTFKNTIDNLRELETEKMQELKKIGDKMQDLEEHPERAKYYDTFWGHKVSDYALENGRLDYGTLSKCIDAVLCNNIVEADPNIFDCVESGDLWEYYDKDWEQITREKYDELNEQGEETHEQEIEVYQWFIVSWGSVDLLKEAGELVLYSELLDCYVWGVCHWGTSWDYVVTNIKLMEREGE